MRSPDRYKNPNSSPQPYRVEGHSTIYITLRSISFATFTWGCNGGYLMRRCESQSRYHLTKQLTSHRPGSIGALFRSNFGHKGTETVEAWSKRETPHSKTM
ncbi:hypothetical protein RRG08_019333 [Elysia crispata]|uniref:Uncharacterized protein n=1 Tax=Elysia crispata TaxID=231223 RepID=A0AAE0Z4U5_9GAST|nr:hypothetical protein RRG08_019333 [Elysia crispata]